MNRRGFLRGLAPSLLVALLVAGCSALAHSATPSATSPSLHHAPGGGYVPGDTTYHGSGGP
jgi:Spy/CpxP family protein refolding chaperone